MDKDSRNTAKLIKQLPASGKQALNLFAAGYIAGAAIAKKSEENAEESQEESK
jgi:hypothetical protein